MDEREKRVREIVGTLLEPTLQWKIDDLQLLRYIRIDKDVLRITVELISDAPELTEQFGNEVRSSLAPLGFADIHLTLRKANTAGEGIAGIRRIFMVGSGKGGVGKSSIAVNIAVTLKQRGYRVGLLDADIYGPSVPLLLNTGGVKPRVLADEVLEPVVAHDIKVLSMGNLIPADSAISWRGQLVSGTILQFVRKTDWGFLDYLIIDMPPGTGDVQLTLASELKVSGAIMVSMDQELVIGDVVRSIALLEEKQIPLVGIVRNMTSFCCEKCGHEQTIFTGGGKALESVDVLANFPLDKEFCLSGNTGIPYMLVNKSGEICYEFNRLADTLEKFSDTGN
jgi:ATP-binding protein involved in chromosome partitioning